VKRIVIIAALAVTAMLLLTALAAGQTEAQKGTPAGVTAKAKPKVDKTSPFKFKISGALTLPPRICTPGATGQTSCIPLNCGPGVTNAKYCGVPTLAQICGGKVRVTIKKGSRTLKKKTVKLNTSTCTYKATLSFKNKKKHKLKGVKAKVSTRFLGNTVFKPMNAKTLKVKVGKK
jgi:hypothetical protein